MKQYYKFLSNKLMRIYIVYVVLFTIVAYSTCLLYVKNDFRHKEQKNMVSITEKFDNYLSYATDIASTYALDSVVLHFSQLNDFDSTVVSNVMQSLTTNLYISDINSVFAFVNPSTEHAILQTGSTSLKFFSRNYGIEYETLKENIEKIASVNENRFVLLSSKYSPTKGSKYMILLNSVKTNLEKPIIFIALCDLNNLFESVIERTIPSIVNVELPKYNLSIFYNEKNDIFFDPSESNISNLKCISSVKKDYTFWGKISASVYTPYSNYYLYINNFLLLLSLFIVALGFIGSLFIKNATRQLYNPIKKLVHTLPVDTIKTQSDEFSALGKYFSSLISQKNVMSDIIQENKIELMDFFLGQLLTSSLTNAQIKNKIVTHSLEDVKFPAVAFIITYKNFEDLKSILSNDGLSEVRATLHEYFKDSFSSASFFKTIDINQSTIAGIISSDNLDNLTEQLKKCILSIELALDINLTAFLGSPALSWYDIPSSYNTALSIKNKVMVISDQSIVISKNIAMDNNTVIFPTEQENELINNILNADLNKTTILLNKIIDENIDRNFLSNEYYSQFILMLYSTIVKVLTKINKTEKEVFAPISVYLELKNCADTDTLKSTAMQLISRIISNISATQKKFNESNTGHIISYINNHYMENISLFTLAEYLNMSQSYASKTFKQCTGEHFKDYLANIRLEKAITLMKENPYTKLNDIAKAVGYSSTTLTRAFTQKYNITPSDYIQKLRDTKKKDIE